ncbi:MAG: M14 family zinc carboxypeptidase [Bacteroidota bacterium]|nr:M14 family zinc carboxypeptidase [Bacteroidota bacterium]
MISTRTRIFMTAILFCCLAHISLNAQWTKSVHFDDTDMAMDLAEAQSFQKYPTYYQYLEMMEDYATAYPDICRLDTIGYSVEDRLLLALKISDNVNEDEEEADFLYTSTMHGDEVIGYVLLLRLADTLLKGYGQDAEIDRVVNNLQIWINPLANPDGSFSNDNGLSLENATRENVHNIDLNRDYPVAISGEADDTTGRELETRNMMHFHRENGFTLSANIHSGAEVVNYPWDDRVARHADDDWYRFVSREYADEAMAVDPDYMFGWPDNGITNGWDWYEALGTRQDYVNYYLGGREVTLELSSIKLIPSGELDFLWNINQRPLLNYMSQCLYGIRGRVTDLETGDPLRARIFVESHDSAYSVVHSSATHGDYYRLIKEGVYDLVVSAPGYFNDTILNVSVTDYEATLLNIQLEPWGLSVPDQGAPAFRIYPNPAMHSFMVEAENMPHGELELSVHSMDGKMIYHNKLPYHGSGIELSTTGMEPGIYLVHCSSGTLSEVYRLMVIQPW